jgi:hypothetical protein
MSFLPSFLAKRPLTGPKLRAMERGGMAKAPSPASSKRACPCACSMEMPLKSNHQLSFQEATTELQIQPKLFTHNGGSSYSTR